MIATDWKISETRIDGVKSNLQKLIQVAALIELAQFKYDNLMIWANASILDQIPGARQKAFHEADITRRAAIRLRIYFTNLNNEISL